MENNKTHILIVYDDNRIRDLLKEYLNDDYILHAESIIYSKKRIQTGIIILLGLVLILAFFLIKFKQ